MLKPFQRKIIKFGSRGLQICRPVDDLDENYYLSLRNIRVYQDGALRTRPGLTARTAATIADTPIHSIRVLNDDIAGASQVTAAIVGAGTKLYTSNAAFTVLTLKDSGYSGNYLSLVPHRPDNSPEPWMYVGDSARMRKVNVGGTNYAIGIAPPNTPPTAVLGVPSRKVVQDFDTAADWTQGGTAGAPTSAANNRVNTTIAAILYDTGTTGWALVKPTAMTADIQPGLRLTFGATAETAVVENVFNPISDSTIGSITYDSGTSGACTIQLAAPSPTGIELNMMLYDSTKTEYVRVLSFTVGPDGLVSFRCSTVATFVAGDTIQGLASFRAYLTGTRAAADALKATYTTTNVTVGVGYVTATAALDLTTTGTSGRPLGDQDEMHISIRVSDLSLLKEGRIELDVDASTNDFTKNYYYFPFRANDLTPAVAGTITTISNRQQILIRRRVDLGSSLANHIDRAHSTDPFGRDAPVIDDVNLATENSFETVTTDLPPGQTTTGASQWTELRFKLDPGTLIRVGADGSRSLKNVAKIRVQVDVTGTIDLDMDSWWVGGGYGPDSLDFPINYRWRYRSSTTGAVSNAGPAMRQAIEPHRESVALSALTASADAQVDKVDIYRIGGTLLDWTYVGTVANGTTTFTDVFLDTELLSNLVLETDNWQPFPVLDVPRAGTCSVSGTKVTQTAGDTFNTMWAPGSIIIIDGVPYTLFASPSSTTVLETAENVGTKAGVNFQLPAPTLMGQPLPTLFGPYGGGATGIFMFAVGSPQQPGTLFWTKGNNPDSAPTANQLEITSPSEQLVTGCVYDGRPYVFTSERMYVINDNFGGSSDFIAQEVRGGRGALSRWGIAVGDKIYFIAKDGIYATIGGDPVCITDVGLYNLFKHDATDTNNTDLFSVAPIDYTASDAMRLSFFNGYLYFTYKTSGGVFETLIYDCKRESWTQEQTVPRVSAYYGIEGKGFNSLILGGINGKLYAPVLDANDDSATVGTRIFTRFEDMGDPRVQKLFRDIVFDYDRGSETIFINVYINNDPVSAVAAFTLTTGTGRQQSILDLNAGAGFLAKTVALEVIWLTNNATAVKVYGWNPSYVEKNERIESRFTDWTDAGTPGDKRVMGFMIDADTYGVDKIIQLQYDGGTLGQSVTINHNGQRRKSYAVIAPFNAKLLRISPQDEVPWYLEDLDWITEPVPELLQLSPDFNDAGDPRAKWLQGFELEADTQSNNVTLTLQGDGAILETFTANHPGRLVVPYSLTPDSQGQMPIVHEMRLIPNGEIRVWNVRWVWIPEAELVGNWITPPMALEGSGYIQTPLGFSHLRDCYISHRSTAPITLVVNVDGVDWSMIVPASGGLYRKTYLVFPPLKGKAWQFRLTSEEPFRLYADDSEVRAKTWGTDAYEMHHPFGINQTPDASHTGAEI